MGVRNCRGHGGLCQDKARFTTVGTDHWKVEHLAWLTTQLGRNQIVHYNSVAVIRLLAFNVEPVGLGLNFDFDFVSFLLMSFNNCACFELMRVIFSKITRETIFLVYYFFITVADGL